MFDPKILSPLRRPAFVMLIFKLGLLTTNEKHLLCQHLRKKIEVTKFRNAYTGMPTTQSPKQRQGVA